MSRLKIGVCVRFKNPTPWARDWQDVYREHLEYVAAADRLGFDGVWVPEHHCVASGYNPAPFVSLAAIAQVTRRCWLGTQPLLLPLHHPVLAAEQAAAVDVMSGGRLILGVGAGYRDGDFEVIGVDRRERGRRTEECLDILVRALKTQVRFDFDGEFYKLRGVELYPKPVRSGGPELELAVRSEAAARRAARHPVSVNLLAREAAAQFGPMVAAAAAAAGREPASIGATVLRAGFLARTPEEASDSVRPYLAWDVREYEEWQSPSDPDDKRLIEARRASGGAPLGAFTAADLIEAMEVDVETMAATGLRPSWINLSLWPPGMPLAEALDCLERVSADVLPHFQRQEPPTHPS